MWAAICGRRLLAGVALGSECVASGLVAHGFGDRGTFCGSVRSGEVAERSVIRVPTLEVPVFFLEGEVPHAFPPLFDRDALRSGSADEAVFGECVSDGRGGSSPTADLIAHSALEFVKGEVGEEFDDVVPTGDGPQRFKIPDAHVKFGDVKYDVAKDFVVLNVCVLQEIDHFILTELVVEPF